MNPTEYDWLDHPFKFFLSFDLDKEGRDKLIGQAPKFDIMGVPAGKLIITEVEKVAGGIQLTVQRRNQ